MNETRSRCVLLAVILLHLMTASCAKNKQWSIEKTPGVRYTKHFAKTTALSDIACAYNCVWKLPKGRCFVANYNSVTMACTLIEDASTFVTDVNWDAFKVVGMCFRFLYRNGIIYTRIQDKKK